MAKDKGKAVAHSISGFSLIPEYENNGKYYGTINNGKKSKELPFNTLFDIQQMVIREVGKKGNTVILRKGRKELVLKLK